MEQSLREMHPKEEDNDVLPLVSVNEEMQDALSISRLGVDLEIEEEKNRIIVEVEDIIMIDDLIGSLGKEGELSEDNKAALKFRCEREWHWEKQLIN